MCNCLQFDQQKNAVTLLKITQLILNVSTDQKEFCDYLIYWLSYVHFIDCILLVVKL